MTNSSIQREVEVPLPIEEAFTLFTSGFAEWWPAEDTTYKYDLGGVVFETGPGARWYEHNKAGERFDYGDILAWNPPERVLLAWQLTPDFAIEPDKSKASAVDVRFEATGESKTRVLVEHRELDRHGEGSDKLYQYLDGAEGWTLYLDKYKAAAELEVAGTTD